MIELKASKSRFCDDMALRIFSTLNLPQNLILTKWLKATHRRDIITSIIIWGEKSANKI